MLFNYSAVKIIHIIYLQMLVKNIPLTLLIDSIMRLKGREPLMLKNSRRIMYSTKAVYFFSFKEYKMINKNFIDLQKYIPASEM